MSAETQVCSMCRQMLPVANFSPKSHRCRTCNTNYVRARRHGGAASMVVTQLESRVLSRELRDWPVIGEPGALLASFNLRPTWLLDDVKEAA